MLKNKKQRLFIITNCSILVTKNMDSMRLEINMLTLISSGILFMITFKTNCEGTKWLVLIFMALEDIKQSKFVADCLLFNLGFRFLLFLLFLLIKFLKIFIFNSIVSICYILFFIL